VNDDIESEVQLKPLGIILHGCASTCEKDNILDLIGEAYGVVDFVPPQTTNPCRELMLHLGDGGSRTRGRARKPKYNRILEIQAPGHGWFTALRSSVKICNPLFGKLFAMDMGFLSPAALEFWGCVKDIHKGQYGVEVQNAALIEVFKWEWYNENPANIGQPVEKFQEWLRDDQDDETFAFYAYILLVIMPALSCMVCGTRNRDIQTYTASMRMFILIWFLFGNEIYGPDTFDDIMLWFLQSPPEIFEFYDNFCWSVNGQGSELVVCEESIKQTKQFVTAQNAANYQCAVCMTDSYKEQRARDMMLAGMKEVDLEQRTPVDTAVYRQRMLARGIKRKSILTNLIDFGLNLTYFYR
jgi:hypothetical protein